MQPLHQRLKSKSSRQAATMVLVVVLLPALFALGGTGDQRCVHRIGQH